MDNSGAGLGERFLNLQDSLLHPVFKPVTSARHFEDRCVVQETVQDGSCGGNIPDQLSPFLDRAVGGHQGGAHLISSHDDFKEVLPGSLR